MTDCVTNGVVKETEKFFFRASAKDFKKIPGNPIAFWFGDTVFSVFEEAISLNQCTSVKTGMTTADNDRFLRQWYEVSIKDSGFRSISSTEARSTGKKWFPYNKGGGYRKWYGFNENLINWEFDGKEIKENIDEHGKKKASVRAEEFYFQPSITYSSVTSSSFSARISEAGFLFDSGGSSIFCQTSTDLHIIGSIMCSVLPGFFLSAFNETINFQPGDVGRIPILSLHKKHHENVISLARACVALSKDDWNSYETSWDFTVLSLLQPDHQAPKLKANYHSIRAHWREMTLEMQRLEEENNHIFIEAYGLQDALPPEVPLKEITLTCNPHYRYGGDKTEEELEALLLADTMRELISYAVGCMFGRYSLDKPGLILANQGETLADYLAQVPEPTFMPDKDNVIPMLDGDWFADDIAERFRRFLRVTLGDEHYEENLRFIEQALNIKGKRNYSLRDYFLSEFYTDHLKRYKKRPIYWLFSSPKGSFNALIYMHRYRPDTASVVLNDYLREFRAKLLARKNHLEALGISASTSQSDKTKALKEVEKISKMIAEVDAYERDTLYPLATRQLEIDLDDGVKANYPKFGAALKKIPGLEAKDD